MSTKFIETLFEETLEHLMGMLNFEQTIRTKWFNDQTIELPKVFSKKELLKVQEDQMDEIDLILGDKLGSILSV